MVVEVFNVTGVGENQICCQTSHLLHLCCTPAVGLTGNDRQELRSQKTLFLISLYFFLYFPYFSFSQKMN